ncbi:hypothetical protein PAMP_004038 [Pampus punctatissimus]
MEPPIPTSALPAPPAETDSPPQPCLSIDLYSKGTEVVVFPDPCPSFSVTDL